ncbi:rCG21618, partial [Rattus norvegicus]
MCMHSAQR